MPETIETFVKRLKDDGVAAGQAEAQTIRAKATQEAEAIVAAARAEAERIVGAARAEAKRLAEAQHHELRLASRDALLALRSQIVATITAALRAQAGAALKDGAFLKQLLTDVVAAYAREGAAGKTTIAVAINEDTFKAVADWGLAHVAGAQVELHGALRQAGFEYRAGESTVEVTPDAVVELLRERVSARLHQVLAEALKG